VEGKSEVTQDLNSHLQLIPAERQLIDRGCHTFIRKSVQPSVLFHGYCSVNQVMVFCGEGVERFFSAFMYKILSMSCLKKIKQTRVARESIGTT